MSIKAAAYCRYSSDNQREESIDAQIRAIKDFAQKQGFEIVKVYVNEAKSATTADRPNFLQMIKDSSLGWFEVVMVHKLDRFARNRYDSAFYKRKLKENGVRLISVLEPLDDSPESIILESVLEGMAEYYSANLARETLKGLKENAFECKHNGGLPPLGYDVDPLTKKYTLNEHEAKIVKMIFDMYASGASYSEIIDKLNTYGYQTKRGKTFGKNSLHEILRNEKYTGIYIFNAAPRKINGKYNCRKQKKNDEIIRIPGGMPQIIDFETWKKVQEKLNKNKHAPAQNSAKEIYLLSGLIYCGNCGGAMVGNRRHIKGEKYVSYECSTRKRKRICSMKSIKADDIEKRIIEHLEENVFSTEKADIIAQKVYDYAISQYSEINKDIKIFETQLVQVEKEIKNIVDAIAAGMFHPSMKEKMDELEAKKSHLIQELEEAKLQAHIHLPNKNMIKAYIIKDANIKSKSKEEQKKIVQMYIKKIIVYENSVEIINIVDLNGCGGGI